MPAMSCTKVGITDEVSLNGVQMSSAAGSDRWKRVLFVRWEIFSASGYVLDARA